MAFEGANCGVPLLAGGHFWLQPVPMAHALVSMDVSDPMHPREVSRVKLDNDEWPHWISMDHTGRRVAMNSGGYGKIEGIAGSPALVLCPAGKGNVLLFGLNPAWRGETVGSYQLLFNAIANWQNLQIDEPQAAKAESNRK